MGVVWVTHMQVSNEHITGEAVVGYMEGEGDEKEVVAVGYIMAVVAVGYIVAVVVIFWLILVVMLNELVVGMNVPKDLVDLTDKLARVEEVVVAGLTDKLARVE
jgi:hypothetical protein